MKKLKESWFARLKKERENQGLSQDRLARHVGAYQRKYAHWESGRSEPDYKTLVELCDVLGITIDYLLKGEPSEQSAGPTARELLIQEQVRDAMKKLENIIKADKQ